MPRVLPTSLYGGQGDNISDKLIRLQGKPWRCETSQGKAGDGERLQAARAN